jgi:hypothetical protein
MVEPFEPELITLQALLLFGLKKPHRENRDAAFLRTGPGYRASKPATPTMPTPLPISSKAAHQRQRVNRRRVR